MQDGGRASGGGFGVVSGEVCGEGQSSRVPYGERAVDIDGKIIKQALNYLYFLCGHLGGWWQGRLALSHGTRPPS